MSHLNTSKFIIIACKHFWHGDVGLNFELAIQFTFCTAQGLKESWSYTTVTGRKGRTQVNISRQVPPDSHIKFNHPQVGFFNRGGNSSPVGGSF